MRSLQKLRNLVGGQCTDAVLRTLFLEQLPDNVRNILAISEVTNLFKLAQLVDRVIETSNVAEIDVIARASSIENAIALREYKDTMDTIAKQMKELCEIHSRCRSRSRDRNMCVGIDQDPGKMQEHPRCAIIITFLVKKHIDASYHVSGRSHSRRTPARKTSCVVQS